MPLVILIRFLFHQSGLVLGSRESGVIRGPPIRNHLRGYKTSDESTTPLIRRDPIENGKHGAP